MLTVFRLGPQSLLIFELLCSPVTSVLFPETPFWETRNSPSDSNFMVNESGSDASFPLFILLGSLFKRTLIIGPFFKSLIELLPPFPFFSVFSLQP